MIITVLDLAEFQQTLPEAPKALANYAPFSKTGNLVITAGILPLDEGKLAFTGRLENDQDITKGQQAARLACLNALSVLKLAIGDLNKVKQVIKLNGYVSSHPDFFEQPSVLNGASDLLVDAFGEEIGKHARAAVGVAALPKNATIEVELIVEVLP